MLVLADLSYLYRLSSQAMMDDPRHSSNLKGTHLTRVAGDIRIGSFHNATIKRYGIAKDFHEGQGPVTVRNLPPPPPLPDDDQELEVDHHQQHIQMQQERHPPQQSPDMLYHQALEESFHNLNDKRPILNILQQAGLQIEDLDQRTIDELPTWSHIQRLYGDEPRIVGLETCEAFRESVDARTRFFGVAGTFNSGTNLGMNWVLSLASCCPVDISDVRLVHGSDSIHCSGRIDGQKLPNYGANGRFW